MEDRRLEHFRNVRAVHGRTRIARVRDGEADLVVDDDVQRATGVEGARLRQLQGFRDHALASERSVAMDLDGQHLGAGRVAAPFLPGPHGTLDHRVDHFQMRRIEGERDMHVAGRGLQIRGEALVVLHVARALQVGHVVLAFEFRENIRGRLAEQVHEHIQAAAVGHADDRLFHTAGTGLLDDVIQQRNQRLTALQREPALSDVLGVQVALQTFRAGELPEDILPLLETVVAADLPGLELILQPQTLIGRGDMRELGADGATVDGLQAGQDIAQLHALGDAAVTGGREELGVQVGIAETEIGQVQHFRTLTLHESEGVKLRDQMTAVRPDLDQARDGGLFGAVGGIGAARRGGGRDRWPLGPRGNARDDRTVRALGGGTRAQAVEIGSPLRRY